MIGTSIPLMTAIDLLIMAVATYVGFRILKNLKRVSIKSDFIGQSSIVAGLVLIAVFFSTDLYAMWVMPRLVGLEAAMSTMQNLHLNVTWFVAPLAVCTIAWGVLRLNETLNAALERTGESEDRYRQLAELSPEGIMVHTEGTIVFANQSMAKIFGAESPEQLIGKAAINLAAPEERQNILESRKIVDAGGVTPLAEAKFQRLDGSETYVERAVAPVIWNDKRSYLVIFRDINERKRVEDQLRQSQKMEAVGQLTGGVAHDFNNLLAVILGNTELLEDQVGDNRLLATIDRAAKRGAELTQRLLSFSRRQTLAPQPIDLTELIPGLHDLLHRTLGEPVKIVSDVGEDTWTVLADPGQLENALLNLAINARDAMPGGGILEIGCDNVQLQDDGIRVADEVPSGEYVQISVRDTGAGMPEDVLKHAFEPFYSTKDAGEGSGLGLSMVYGFARQSGGDAVIESEPGKGTKIKMILPRAGTNVASEDPTHDGDLKRGGGEVILVLEDDPDVRSLAVAALEGLGYRVREASEASTAMQAFEEEDHIDLLLSDVVLPGGVNGPELAVKAKDLHPQMRVLFMTGYASGSSVNETLSEADITVLSKPFRRKDLAKAIQDTLAA